MPKPAITERQQYWLNHLTAAHDSNGTVIEYAEANGLKVKDLYQWKTLLAKRGHWTTPACGFVPISSNRSRSSCCLVLPNGARLEFLGELRPEIIRSIVACASELS